MNTDTTHPNSAAAIQAALAAAEDASVAAVRAWRLACEAHGPGSAAAVRAWQVVEAATIANGAAEGSVSSVAAAEVS